MMRKIMPWISLNGQILRQGDAAVSALDSGLLYGYGIFTTLKVHEAVPLFLESHLLRLQEGIQRLAFHFSARDACLGDAVHAVIQRNEVREGAIRITITPGTQYQVLLSECPSPTLLVYATHMHTAQNCIDVITVPDQRGAFRNVKVTNRLVHFQAEREAFSRGAQEALFTENDQLIEATNSNIFSLGPLGEFITPPIEGRGLNGIMRQHLLDYSGGKVAEIATTADGPLFLVNSLRAVAVRRVDGRDIVQNDAALQKMRGSIGTMEQRYIESHQLSYEQDEKR